MWPISITEICIYNLPQKLDIITLKPFIWLHIHHNIWFFWTKTSHCEIDAWNFLYFIWWASLWPFGHHTFYFRSLSIFPSQILVYAIGFCSSISLFIWRFTFGALFKQKQQNKWVGRYIDTSLYMSQDQQNHSLIIHDKFKDLFTTIT